ncbi:MAG: DNA polymerase III subunit [Solobacterium sp.]|nr:DNA polymerase III subunit [Solobacterium sp.]
MHKETLKLEQKNVYRLLENVAEGKGFHAYIFSGPLGTPKYEAALLLAQTIFCEKGGVACEECEHCRRIAEGEYGDVIVIDGREKSITKEDIDGIQERFSKTAMEEGNGERVYIIRNIENATIAAQNGLLKFLEDPKENVIAILTTDNINRILPTIKSRCVTVNFLPKPQEDYMEAALNAGVREEDAYFLSHIAKDIEDINDLYESDAYAGAINMFKQYLNVDGLVREELLVDYEISWKNNDAKASTMTQLVAFMELLSLYGRDVLRKQIQGASWYKKAIENAHKDQAYYAKLITIAETQKDKVNKYNNLDLVLGQTMYRLEELDHEFK